MPDWARRTPYAGFVAGPTERVEVVVLVKAAPVLTSHLDETMCVAGARVDDGRCEWIRLHPVPFRDLASSQRFAKYQVVKADVIRSKTDRRPESRMPLEGSIVPGPVISPENGWADRRQLVGQLPEVTMCELNERNAGGSGPGVPSLGVVRPIAPPELLIDIRDQAQLDEWKRRAEQAKGRISLFDDPVVTKPDFEVVPWRFRYRYSCARPGCTSHSQTIVDWEVSALWRKVRERPNWQALMRDKFERQMHEGRDTVLFVGNQEQHPGSFLVLGIFWPPDRPYQPRLGV